MQQLASRYRRYRRPSGGDAMRVLSRGGSRRLPRRRRSGREEEDSEVVLHLQIRLAG